MTRTIPRGRRIGGRTHSNRPYAVVLVLINVAALGLMGLLAPLTRELRAEFRIGLPAVGLFEALFLAVHVAAMPFWAWLTLRITRRRLLLVSTLIWSACCGLVALTGNVWLFGLGFLTAGVGSAAVVPCTYSMMADLLPLRERGKNFGWLASAQTMGVGLALLVGGAASESGGWRLAFLVFAGIGTVLALALILRFREEPQAGAMERRRFPPAELPALLGEDRVPSANGHPRVWLVLSGFLSMVPIGAASFWFVALLRNEQGYSSWAAANLMIAVFIIQVPGSIFIGALGDRLAKTRRDAKIRLLLIATLLTLPCYLLGFGLMAGSAGPVLFAAAVTFLALGALTSSAIPPLSFNVANDISTLRKRSQLLSAINVCRIIGRAVGVQLTALLAAAWFDGRLPFGLMAVCLLLIPSAACVGIVARTLRNVGRQVIDAKTDLWQVSNSQPTSPPIAEREQAELVEASASG